jgi:CheY-like chemotaxis protein
MTHHDHQEIVLIVEDDVETAKALAELLSLESFDSIIVENGQEAMAMLRTGRRPCLILLDIMMPGMDGWELRDAVLSDPGLSTIPIVLVTADTAAFGKAATLSVPIIRKPVDAGQLLDEVRRFC